MECPNFVKDITTKYSGPGEKRLVVSHYQADKSPALLITSIEGEPLLTASVCIDGTTHENDIIIKDWSENEGIATALVAANLIKPFENEILHASGYAVATEYEMINELLEAWKQHLAQKPW